MPIRTSPNGFSGQMVISLCHFPLASCSSPKPQADETQPESFLTRMKCTLVRRGGSYSKAQGYRVSPLVLVHQQTRDLAWLRAAYLPYPGLGLGFGLGSGLGMWSVNRPDPRPVIIYVKLPHKGECLILDVILAPVLLKHLWSKLS